MVVNDDQVISGDVRRMDTLEGGTRMTHARIREEAPGDGDCVGLERDKWDEVTRREKIIISETKRPTPLSPLPIFLFRPF